MQAELTFEQALNHIITEFNNTINQWNPAYTGQVKTNLTKSITLQDWNSLVAMLGRVEVYVKALHPVIHGLSDVGTRFVTDVTSVTSPAVDAAKDAAQSAAQAKNISDNISDFTIKEVSINDVYHLIITFNSGRTVDLGSVQGEGVDVSKFATRDDVQSAIGSANAYTYNSVADALAEATSVATSKAEDARRSAYTYTDSTTSDAVANANAYADDAVAQALSEAKEYTDQELAEFDFIKIVDSLPSTGLSNKIYLVPKDDTQTQDLFDEYVWANGKWEWVTTKQIEVDVTGKLDKVTSEGSERVYTVTGTGQQTVTQMGSGNAVNTIVKRDSAGRFYCTGPLQDQQVANKVYVDTKVSELRSALTDLIYPVGSIYMSVSATDPTTIFGGTWEKIKDKFLLAAGDTYSAGTTGGSATNTHNHWQTIGVSSAKTLFSVTQDGAPRTRGRTEQNSLYFNPTSGSNGNVRENSTHDETIDILPPYIAVNVWKRVS